MDANRLRSAPDAEYRELVSNVIACFLATHGYHTKSQFESDEDFAESLRDAALVSMATIALAITENDEAFRNKTVRLVGDPRNDADPVALLRMFAIKNFAPDSHSEVSGAAARLKWFRNAYTNARGGETHPFS